MGQRYYLQSFLPCAATDNRSFDFKRYPEMAGELRWLRLRCIHSAIDNQPGLTNLGHQSSRTRCCERPIHGHKFYFWHAAVFPVEPTIIAAERSIFKHDCSRVLTTIDPV